MPIHAQFVYEDAILHDHIAASPGLVRSLLTGPSYALTTWTEAIQGGPDALHAGNVGLHVVNGLLVLAVALAWAWPWWSALLAAAIFSLAPIQSEAVGYIAGRSELLTGLGCLLTLWACVSCRSRWVRAPIAGLGIAVALAAKPAGMLALMPLVLVVPVLSPPVLALGVGLTTLAAARHIPSMLVAAGTVSNGWDIPSYAAMQTLAFWRDAALVVVPRGLTVDHDFDYVSNLIVYGSCAGFVALLVGAWWMRKRWPWATFGVFWAVLALAGRFVVPIGEYINEHQWYVPMIGISLALAAVLTDVEARP